MDNDDPGDLMTIPQLLCMTLYVMCVIPITVMIATVMDWNVRINRTVCTNCGYRMVELETSCPKCRANQQRMK